MKTLIVGGNFGDTPKSSGIITKLSCFFENNKTINGGSISELPTILNSKLTIWMPNISNENEKMYPHKQIGNILIVSKVMRDGYTMIDAIERIFKMHGNAVIAIYKESVYRFKLIDALGNVWYDGTELVELSNAIKDFCVFTESAIRCISKEIYEDITFTNINDASELITINNSLSNYIQSSCGERFFGNISTRCSKLFPSFKSDDAWMYVSPRNVDKDKLCVNDMVACKFVNNEIHYLGNKKPSIDSPIQLNIYNNCKHISFMIHGHAFINNVPYTHDYYLCGDLRESKEVIKIIGQQKAGAINLKNHGFLLYADTLQNLKTLISKLTFSYHRENI